MSVFSPSSADEYQKKIQSPNFNLIVVYFYASWSGTCSTISPKFEDASTKYDDVFFIKIDVEANDFDVLADRTYNVNVVPTFTFIKNNMVLTSFNGANYEKLISTIDKYK
ncbi:Thiol-disulfide isomerase or thioredoxin [Kosakonia arachidis]|uniref:Thiol-disulfide isomerase or thioredoxin n=1 Tax=Kosakonia arachidis TaxID=551989 RepID=A0A1I7EAI2_9ENTR|nr:thioredoxin family protein [Kosakonia arachidis]SFU20863.1 Thiol-disulfide isomerase or thioredoxin [Kosakonia arachidis]